MESKAIEEMQFKGEATPDGECTPYVAYTPSMVKMITQGSSKPPLCKVGDGMGAPIVYDVDGIKMFVHLKLTQENEDWSCETPLAMCRYVKPEGEMLFNIQACEDATVENARRRLHNKFVVDIFREFMPHYDCGASANRMTEPQPPPNFVEERLGKIKELKKDKLGSTQKAIEYLAMYEMYCGRDYKFEEAFDRASDRCFEETIKTKQKVGKVRVRIEGRKPCWWNGVYSTDESGCRVKWIRGDGHTFLTPDVRVVRDDTITALIVSEGCGSVVLADPASQTAAAESSNPFETLFPPAPPSTPAGQSSPDSVIVEEVSDGDGPNCSQFGFGQCVARTCGFSCCGSGVEVSPPIVVEEPTDDDRAFEDHISGNCVIEAEDD